MDSKSASRRLWSFVDVVAECLFEQGLVDNFNRLYGCKIDTGQNRSAIAIMVDRATGHHPIVDDSDGLRAFVEFVREYVWEKMPPESFVWLTDEEVKALEERPQ